MKVNIHGLIGLIAIGAMISVCAYRNWNIPWLYVLLASFAYSGVIIIMSAQESPIDDELLELQIIWGSHLSYLLLAGGIFINVTGFWENVAIFITAISLGFAIPFMLVKR